MKIHFIYISIILLILFGGFWGYNIISKNHQRELEEKIRIEEKVKQLESDGISQKHYTDSVKNQAVILEGILEYMKKNPKLIIEKYDKERTHVVSLADNDKVKFLADRLSKSTKNW